MAYRTRSGGGAKSSQGSVGGRAGVVMRGRTMRQTVGYVIGTGLGSIANGLAKALLAALLSVASFGAFAVAQSVLSLVASLCEFGLFVPAARLSALAPRDEQRQIVGAALVLYVPVAAVFVIATLATSIFVDGLFHVHIASALRVTSPLSVAWPFALVGLMLAQGVGRLQIASVASLTAGALFLALVAGAKLVTGHASVVSALVMQDLGLLASMGLAIALLQPAFVHVKHHARRLAHGARTYGLQVYVGRVLSIGTYNLDVLMLAALTDPRSVAYYALAGTIATGIGLPVTGFANALFARMAGSPRIAASWLRRCWAVGLLAVPVAWLATTLLVGTVFSPSYTPVITLVIPLTAAQAVRGVTGVYNNFLSAHGRGAELRNAALVLTVSNVILNFGLIPPFGAQGAAWASLLALVANWLAHVVGYRRLVSRPTASVKHRKRY